MGRQKAVCKVESVSKMWLSTREATLYMDCSLDFLETLRNEGEVSFSQYKKKIWYNLQSINRFLEKNKVI